MRAGAAALAAGLALALVGCGDASRTAGSTLGHDAAALVPPDAVAFVSVDTELDSKQWQVVERLTGGLTMLRKSLREKQLDLEGDVRPALGPEVDLAVLGVDKGKPEAIALARPEDEAKLRALAATFDQGDEHYTVERVGEWSVVADSQEAFAAVRSASSGRSLADVADFKSAMAKLDGDSLATAYASGTGLDSLPGSLGALVRSGGSPRWVAARLAEEGDAVRLQLYAESPNPAPALYQPQLLRDVPSGAILAVSFKDLDRPLARLAAEPKLRASLRTVERYLGMPLAQLRPALRGEGAFYVLPGALLPLFALEVVSPNPDVAVRSLRLIATRLRAKTGNALPVRVARYGSRVVLTDAPARFSTKTGSLLDDQPYKDAVAAAGVPADVTFLAYADVHRLAPLVQALSQLLGRGSSRANAPDILDRLGSVVAFGAQSGSTTRLELRLTGR